MAKSWNLVFVLIWTAYLMCAGIHLFSKGFLLTRVAQTETNMCTQYEDYNCTGNNFCTNEEKVTQILKDVNVSSNICLPKKSKVILMVIDALRYDFGVFDPELKEPLPYQNKLPVLFELLNKYPDRTRISKFIADPPTTTLQRLKGMTTGSLPTFIDIGSNFASPEINEDNIIDQIVGNNLTAVLLGDGTWNELFPNRFKRRYSYPSFNIHDLDTIDTAIEKYLPTEIAKDDWDLIIAHFLGVDHCGHKHGPLHPEMTRKLTEMDTVIRDIAKQMDDDTILIVIGDHGMTKTGDHGGDSEDEVTSLFFQYSKNTSLIPKEFAFDDVDIQQIDLAPTLASILGVPIPHSNLGKVNFHLLPDKSVDYFSRYQILLQHLWQNAKQVQNYFEKYADINHGTFALDHLETLSHKFIIFSHRVNSIYTDAGFKSFAKDLKTHMSEITQTCRQIWVKFDSNLISQGLLVTFLAIFSVYTLISNLNTQKLHLIFHRSFINFVISSNFIVGSLAFIFHKDLAMTSYDHSILFTTSIFSCCIIIFLIIQNWAEIVEGMSEKKNLDNKIIRGIFTFSVIVFFSNSFIIQEQKILSYILMSLLIYSVYCLMRNEKISKFKSKMVYVKLLLMLVLAILLLRLSHHYFKCREEQANCSDIFSQIISPVESKKISINNYDLLPIIVLAVLITISRIYLKTCGNLTGFSINVLFSRYGPTVGVICTGGHFILSKTLKYSNIKQIHVDALAWIVYLLVVLQILVIIISPLLIYVLPKTEKNQLHLYGGYSNLAPEIYRHFKNEYNKNAETDSVADIPIVCGLGTVYSATFVALGSILSVVIALLLGATPSIGFCIAITVAAISIIINSILRYETAKSLENCLQPDFGTLVTWLILIQFAFYATSHQPTMSQIDWNAAFVGRTAYYDHSNVFSAILITLNTFGTVVLLNLLYPLLIFGPFFIYSTWPSLSNKRAQKQNNVKLEDVRKTNAGNVEYRTLTVTKADTNGTDAVAVSTLDFDITRGEINLYENDRTFLVSCFKTGCNLMLLQGIKMFCAMLACTVHCRHLMVWKIFAPRFIYEGLATYVSFFAIVASYLIIIRVHHSVNRLIDKINKSN